MAEIIEYGSMAYWYRDHERLLSDHLAYMARGQVYTAMPWLHFIAQNRRFIRELPAPLPELPPDVERAVLGIELEMLTELRVRWHYTYPASMETLMDRRIALGEEICSDDAYPVKNIQLVQQLLSQAQDALSTTKRSTTS